MPVINCIKDNYSNAVISSCSERSCRLKTDDLNNYVILKGERICPNGKRCDCIIFLRDKCIIIGIVELKSRTIHESEIVGKLTNCTEIALNILREFNHRRNECKIFHIVLHKGIRPIELGRIRSKKIYVEGKRNPIFIKRCGISFSEIYLTAVDFIS